MSEGRVTGGVAGGGGVGTGGGLGGAGGGGVARGVSVLRTAPLMPQRLGEWGSLGRTTRLPRSWGQGARPPAPRVERSRRCRTHRASRSSLRLLVVGVVLGGFLIDLVVPSHASLSPWFSEQSSSTSAGPSLSSAPRSETVKFRDGGRHRGRVRPGASWVARGLRFVVPGHRYPRGGRRVSAVTVLRRSTGCDACCSFCHSSGVSDHCDSVGLRE